MMAAHVADITAVSSCKMSEGNQLLSAPGGPDRQKKKSGGLIIKLSKAFLVLFLLVLVNVLKCVAVGAVSQSPLEEMSSFLLRCRRSTTNNASLYEVKTNTRQQLLVKLLEDGRVWGPLWPLK